MTGRRRYRWTKKPGASDTGRGYRRPPTCCDLEIAEEAAGLDHDPSNHGAAGPSLALRSAAGTHIHRFGQRRPVRRPGRVVSRSGRVAAGSAALDARVQPVPPGLGSVLQVAQGHAGRQQHLRIAVDGPHQPVEVGRLQVRYVSHREARELAEADRRGQGLAQAGQLALQRGSGAAVGRTAGRGGARRLALFDVARQGGMAGQRAPRLRVQRGVARAIQRAGVYPGRDRPRAPSSRRGVPAVRSRGGRRPSLAGRPGVPAPAPRSRRLLAVTPPARPDPSARGTRR